MNSQAIATLVVCFNIRSFGSWIASSHALQRSTKPLEVSISALSDRGLLRRVGRRLVKMVCGFNIRSFGSWIASFAIDAILCVDHGFQYPLFRIVDCFLINFRRHPVDLGCFNIRSFGSWIASRLRPRCRCRLRWFQYPLFRIVDCFDNTHPVVNPYNPVSISALSDRGLLQPT